jgi:Topoisomerase IA
MGENLIIVESPAKAKTIEKFLGKDYVVKSSKGHIRDLSEKDLSIDIENNFEPKYVIPADKRAVVSELKAAAAKADTVYLASDEDREGEAISWHLFQTLGLDDKNTKRIAFHEITKGAVDAALDNPRRIDMDLVMAQQARRVLDRLVGFELSPVLWRKIQPKLSAGRVQSVALRLIVDKEREIIAFKPQRFFKVTGIFIPEGLKGRFNAICNGKFTDPQQVLKFLEQCEAARFAVSGIEKKEMPRTPAAPFTTSTLQQEASRRLGFSVKQTMAIAQKLYESGLITYMHCIIGWRSSRSLCEIGLAEICKAD